MTLGYEPRTYRRGSGRRSWWLCLHRGQGSRRNVRVGLWAQTRSSGSRESLPSVPHINGVASDDKTAPNGHTNGNGRTNGHNGTARSSEILEFSGSSDDTIGEAVRQALACASRTLPTLHGAGVRVIPQMAFDPSAPRFRVTLRVTAAPATPPSQADQPQTTPHTP